MKYLDGYNYHATCKNCGHELWLGPCGWIHNEFYWKVEGNCKRVEPIKIKKESMVEKRKSKRKKDGE